jgi:hypothetical protein
VMVVGVIVRVIVVGHGRGSLGGQGSSKSTTVS